MSKLDLGEILASNNPFQNVPNSGTVREQIEYIDIGLIDSDPNNFYELSGIDELAANIELCGLQQPIRVRVNPDDPNRVIIVSGHRRRAAIEKLVQEGREDLREIPCIREQRTGSAALQELQLIYANSDTRRMTSADISKQAERVEALLYQLKEEGYEFPGRMRDHVAEACKVSKSKLSRLKVIRDNLTPYFDKLFRENAIGESTAYEIAKMPHEHLAFIETHQDTLSVPVRQWAASTALTFERRLQAIDETECKGGGMCTNRKNKYTASLKRHTYEPDDICSKCCSECYKLLSCKYACPGLAGKIKKLKADQKAQQEHERMVQREKDMPEILKIQRFWERFGHARALADVEISKCWETLSLSDRYHGDVDKVMAMECLEYEFSTASDIPYGWVLDRRDAEKLINLADLLGCSLDYLLCRTDDPKGLTANAPAEQQQTGLGECRWYPAAQFPDDKQEVIVIDKDWYATDGTFENGRLCGAGFDWDEVLFWTPEPDPDGIVRNAPQPTGQLMIAGWMPGGTTPAEPCEVVAIFDLGNGASSRHFLQWTGSEFAFANGAKIDMEPVKWMQLPPDTDDDLDLATAAMELEGECDRNEDTETR